MLITEKISPDCLLDRSTTIDPCDGFPCFLTVTDCKNLLGYLLFFGQGTLCEQQAAAKLLTGAGQEWWNCTLKCVTGAVKSTMSGNFIPCCNQLDEYGLNTINVDCMLNKCNFCSVCQGKLCPSNFVALQTIF